MKSYMSVEQGFALSFARRCSPFLPVFKIVDVNASILHLR